MLVNRAACFGRRSSLRFHPASRPASLFPGLAAHQFVDFGHPVGHPLQLLLVLQPFDRLAEAGGVPLGDLPAFRPAREGVSARLMLSIEKPLTCTWVGGRTLGVSISNLSGCCVLSVIAFLRRFGD